MLVSLRRAIRRREIWVEGGNTWRHPDQDLPADFEANRDVLDTDTRLDLTAA
ncbi:hypothetical protein [Nonomuraea recticatena]|uniref:Transposase n=1 Tax=Nonomuraea recticatena TaxID=46178 RepID=A0ABN3SBB4_9ACTN